MMTEPQARPRPAAEQLHESGPYATAPADELRPGTVVAGKYRVNTVLGRGGFAVVYEAEHLGLSRTVALKLLQRKDGLPEVLIERFMREVRISALVRHPNVLEVHDAGVHTDGSPFLVMEKIEGLSLHQHLSLSSRLSVEEVVKLARQLLSALVAIGARGIVHRDIKPENLMLSVAEQGELQLKLVDFGIALVQLEARGSARKQNEEHFGARLTQQGTLVGTPHYMAPEQLRAELTDVRADLYATGVVLYQALTGSLPFDGPDLQSLTLDVLNGRARALRSRCPECPRALVRLVERALARDPERRFKDARSMLAALDAACPTTRPAAGSRTPWRAWFTSLPLFTNRQRELLLVAATLTLMALGTGTAEVAGALRATFGASNAHEERGLRAEALARGSLSEAHQRETTAAAFDEPVLAAAVSAESAIPAVGQAEPVASDARATPVEQEPKRELPPPAQGTGDSRGEALVEARVSAREQNVEARSTAREQSSEVRALVKKGLALYLHADFNAAYAAYQKASLLAPYEPSVFRGLGLAASSSGRAQEAQRAFTRYLELAPAAPDARAIRARLAGLISDEAVRGLRGG
jgi:serine/threonine protein kinase/Flp pilus assembly protein TadD